MKKSKFLQLTRHSKSLNVGGGKLFLNNHGKMSIVQLPKIMAEQYEFDFDFENKLTIKQSPYNNNKTW